MKVTSYLGAQVGRRCVFHIQWSQRREFVVKPTNASVLVCCCAAISRLGPPCGEFAKGRFMLPPTQNTRFCSGPFLGKTCLNSKPFLVEGRHDTLKKEGIWSFWGYFSPPPGQGFPHLLQGVVEMTAAWRIDLWRVGSRSPAPKPPTHGMT